MARKKNPNFENALEELEEIVENMESGELSLEDSLKAFEKGIKLTRDCQEALNQAEQRVKILVGGNDDSIPGEQNSDDDWEDFNTDI